MKPKREEHLLREALNHLHWLCVGGDFSYAIEEGKFPSIGGMKEYNEAKEFVIKANKEVFRV